MKSVAYLPQEVVALILQNCDSFRQLRSLILTCKRIHLAWELNKPAILWHVGRAEIPGWTDAIVARAQIRATQIAKDALLKGELPPDPFPVSELSGEVRRPSLEELKQVQSLQKLAKYLESEMLASDEDLFISMPDDQCNAGPIKWARFAWSVWREEFCRAIYRHLTAGAILYRAYLAPIVWGARPADFLAAFITIMESGEDLADVTADWFSDSDRRYLSTVPAYHIPDGGQCDNYFQPLEDVFVEESRKRALLDPPMRPPPPGRRGDWSPPPTLFSTFGQYAPIHNPQSLETSHAEALFHQTLQFIFLNEQSPQQFIWDSPRERQEETKETSENLPSIFAIFFGSFVPLQVTVRDETHVTATAALPGLESKTPTESNYLGFQYMDEFLPILSAVGGIPNSHGNGQRLPDSRFCFAEHMLRKFFGLRFADTIYESTLDSTCAWDALTCYGGVFTNRGLRPWYHGADLFQSSDDPIPTPYVKGALE
ncbi:hypothetical protein P168DRAFT_303636 [Aspergillus campestris IBT 28561]|uniref:F-box domain-containing protein n=1 Tax=Aspergillus campestris (strain IBT 28561) TaxID=1392248 RepID=A0A2I1D7T7_ASPC2|nr:uncharacterized protein P168DRAFT_303636 [Aspergillus campestris IBT 28561]PKY05940.1 hypothetical protein P168DRAFT_303636 [Aspergillus campestris IBT 28561]